jgi:hypothetical protein
LAKSLGFSVLKKEVKKTKAIEQFENAKLQTFIRDMGITVKDGVGIRVRQTKDCRTLKKWATIEETIRNCN